MNRQQIANRVQVEADARFGETVERLLLLLELAQEIESNVSKYIAKWSKSGLLKDIPEDKHGNAAIALENKAIQLIVDEPGGPVMVHTPAWEAYVTKEIRDVAARFIPRNNRPVRLCYCEESGLDICENCRDS